MANSEKKVTEQVTEEVKSKGDDMKVTPKDQKTCHLYTSDTADDSYV